MHVRSQQLNTTLRLGPACHLGRSVGVSGGWRRAVYAVVCTSIQMDAIRITWNPFVYAHTVDWAMLCTITPHCPRPPHLG
eukprot:COSAG02_NODE_3450_length_6721_cov_10.974487_7_plen_80_part_00